MNLSHSTNLQEEHQMHCDLLTLCVVKNLSSKNMDYILRWKRVQLWNSGIWWPPGRYPMGGAETKRPTKRNGNRSTLEERSDSDSRKSIIMLLGVVFKIDNAASTLNIVHEL